MGDPNVDHGFYYDDQGRVDVLHSPFFDVAFGNDTTADEYVERILYQLTLAIEDQLPASRWCLVSRRPSSPNPATSPATSTRGSPFSWWHRYWWLPYFSVPSPNFKRVMALTVKPSHC
ncbi:hypothetical protein M5K25_021114 [Dendrobium thyrsiflorum]|uniref:Uncharacterized protein n=1 Tax=Dendrobium thyrsiflorum TaxID=117978 RepID=A0ABD0UIZ1_DENTH